MPCYHPVDVPVLRKALPGSRQRTLDQVTVPCGRCLGCRASHSRSWAIRLMHESAYWDTLDARIAARSWFLTLTYDQKAVPPDGSLRPEDLSGFFRALRAGRSPRSLSYYGVGEYGGERGRPHYHAVLCGPAFLDRDLSDHRDGFPVWTSGSIAAAWPHGIHELTTLSPASAAYVAGYVHKKLTPAQSEDEYTRVDHHTGEVFAVEREFSRQSLRPAIGLRWIRKFWREVYPRDFVVFDGKEFKPPRYYDKWMDQVHDPEKVRKMGLEPCHDCDEHRSVMADVRLQRYEDAEYLDDAKLIMKEKIHRAREGLYHQRNKL